MHIILLALLIVMLGFALYLLLSTRIPSLPANSGGWGTEGRNDPRIAIAAMMYAVAAEDGPVTHEEERQILALLMARIGLGAEVAKTCLTGGRRLALDGKGTLNSRLHTLLGPIEEKCTPEEKQDVIEMLRLVAGPHADRLGNVRDGLSRVAATLRHG